MTEFDDRLHDAISRGQQRGERKARHKQEQALNEEELKRLHSKHRLGLSEHIETCLQKLPHHFPGFSFETLFGDRGWGAACSRDDIVLSGGKRDNLFTRLEVTVRPYSTYHVVDLAAKGTVRNKELFSRNHFVKIEEVDEAEFIELIDRWVLEFAELYAAQK